MLTLRDMGAFCFFILLLIACKPSGQDASEDGSAAASSTPSPAAVHPSLSSATPSAATSNLTTQCIVRVQNDMFCYEYTDVPPVPFMLNAVKSTCDDQNGVFRSDMGCPRQNSVGGCAQGGSPTNVQSKLVVWYYRPSRDIEGVKSFCRMQNEGYVSP